MRESASSNSSFVFVLLYLSIGLLILIPPTVISILQNRHLRRVKKELIELNERRAIRVKQALSAKVTGEPSATAAIPDHFFSDWVKLLADGTVTVGAAEFRHRQAFQATATDRNAIIR